jgi:mannose-1-phosphate guanylyltransferase
MRHAVILAGGSGTRLWPMSTNARPKQLLPLIHGRSLLELAYERLEGLVPTERRWVCAAETCRSAVLHALPGLDSRRYLGEPVGRDTLNALAYSSAMIAAADPQASLCVLTADQLIEPMDAFRAAAAAAFDVAESGPGILVAFGVAPTHPATGFGYLRLGPRFQETARRVAEYKEKPDLKTAEAWVAEGPERFLWNSGMFVWKAAAFLDCVLRIAGAGDAEGAAETIRAVYPTLRKVSVDYAVMERASRDPLMRVAAVPLALSWRDIGSWPSFAETCEHDAQGNALAAADCLLLDSKGNLVVTGEPGHLIAALGCDDLVIVHTPTATLVCRKDRAEDVKRLQALAAERFGGRYT